MNSILSETSKRPRAGFLIVASFWRTLNITLWVNLPILVVLVMFMKVCMRTKPAAVEKVLPLIDLQPRHPRLKMQVVKKGKVSTPWLSKFEICQQLQRLRGMFGGYTHAKYWKLYLSLLTFPKKENLRFAVHGRGARIGANLLKGWPSMFNEGNEDTATHQFYNNQITEICLPSSLEKIKFKSEG